MNTYTIQKSYAISAGAGSGKTYTLSRRYINAYLGFDYFRSDESQPDYFEEREERRAEIDDIVTITYTNAAALEMQSRIFALMKEELQGSDTFDTLDREKKAYVRSRLKEGLKQIDRAKITTIHGFSFDLIKEHADLLQLDTKIDAVDDLERNKIFESAYFTVLDASREDVVALSDYLSLFKIKEFVKKYLFNKKFRSYVSHFRNDIGLFQKLIREFYRIDREIVDAADREMEGIASWYEDLIHFRAKQDFNAFVESRIGEPLNFRKKLHKENYAAVKVLRDALNAQKFIFDKEAEARFDEVFAILRSLLGKIYGEYLRRLKAENSIDFDLMLDLMHRLLGKKRIAYKYIMVDEFQDTNSLQYEIIKSIRGDNLFIVGDEKQAIYAFQGGEIEVFKRAIEDLDGLVVPLKVNYRSDKRVLDFINGNFESIFREEDELVIESDFTASHQELVPQNGEERGEIEVLWTPEAKDFEEETECDSRELEAKNIALYIKEVVEGRRHPEIKARYIDKNELAIGLVYDAKTYMHLLKRELNALGMDCKVNGGENFWEAKEVKDLFAHLKSMQIIQRRKEVRKREFFYITRALESLGYSQKEIYALQKDTESLREIFDTDCDTLHACIRRIYLGLYHRYENPPQAKANVEALIDEVILLENRHGYDRHTILELLEENFLMAEKQNAFYDSPTANAIELSSIHYTKGLAYPMIILADADKDIASQADKILSYEKFVYEGEEHFAIGFKVDDYVPLAKRVADRIVSLKQIAEKKRLLYVALTRAKHNIVISVKGERGKNSYEKMLEGELEKIERILLLDRDTLHFFKTTDLKRELELDLYDPPKSEREENGFSSEAIVGEAVHKILELYWEDLSEEKIARVIERYGLFDQREKIAKMVENFKNSKVCEELQRAEEVYFELPYVLDESGRIDLVYRVGDLYKIVDFKTGKRADHSEQLQKYEQALREAGLGNVTSSILYLGGEA